MGFNKARLVITLYGAEVTLKTGGRSGSTPLNAWVRALSNTAAMAKRPTVTFPALIESLAEEYGDRPALLSATASLTYRNLAERSNQYARWALANDVHPGDVVGLLMPNCPDYLAIWLGITHVRGVVALINTNLTGYALVHSIAVVAAKYIVVDSHTGGSRRTDPAAASSGPAVLGARTWAISQDRPGIGQLFRRPAFG